MEPGPTRHHARPGSTGRPHIVVIRADDHAAHAISAFGAGLDYIPCLDRLADEGLRNVAADPAYAEDLALMRTELALLQEHYGDRPHKGPDTSKPVWGPALSQH